MTTIRQYDNTDFPNDKWDVARLEQEVKAATLSVGFKHTSSEDASITLHFLGELSTADETALDGIVAAHSGEPSRS